MAGIVEADESTKEPTIVVAIDFGTYASGYAYQWRNDFLNDRLKIYCNSTWPRQNNLGFKTPTVVLLKPNGELFAFGEDAEIEYADLEINDENPADWYLFRQFKMDMYKQQKLTENTMLKSIDGKELPMKLVIGRCIEYMVHHFQQHLAKMGFKAGEEDIRWVLTVPAIWSDAAKQMMRDAAEMAGLKGDRLLLALEPECAAIYCSQLTENHINNFLTPGSNLMVVDLGGGTVDITTVQVTADTGMKQVYMTGGGPWGGNSINQAFMDFLKRLVGDIIWQDFTENHVQAFVDLRRQFEEKKRLVQSALPDDVAGVVRKSNWFDLQMPQELKNVWESHLSHSISTELKSRDSTGTVAFSHGRIRIDLSIIREMFFETTRKVINFIENVVRDPGHHDHGISAVILAGGMAESPVVVNELRESITRHGFPVLVPENPTKMVLCGAILFGNKPNIITSRILRRTYGVSMCKRYDATEHADAQTKEIDGKLYATDLFEAHARRGEEVKVNQWIKGITYKPVRSQSTKTRAYLYASTHRDPKYVTDNECKCLGHVEFEFPEPSLEELASSALEFEHLHERTVTENTVNLSFCFGGTEIRVKAVDEVRNKQFLTKIDLL